MFPFLAVLLCTLGSLILMLILLADLAKLQAATPAVEESAPVDYAARRLQLAKTQSLLEAQVEEITSKLAEERLALSHVEQHARSLRDELALLQAELESLAVAPDDTSAERQALAQQLTAVQQRIEQLQAELVAAEEAARNADVSYAIVPYEGDNATFRRPVYIECREDAILLQPEGIPLTASDFYGPLDASNPLASALRASTEYLAENALTGQGPVGEPYPLFLVRPNGVVAYAVARAALRSWGSEFGYELVDEGWKLKFPPADPGLAAVQREAVNQARERLVRLAQIAPGYFTGRRPRDFDDISGDGDERGEGGTGRGGGSGDGVGDGHGPAGNIGLNGDLAEGSSYQRGQGEDGTGPSSTTQGDNRAPNSASGQNGGENAGDGTSNGQAAGTNAGGAPGGTGGGGGGSPSISASASHSIAQSRGRDWALPSSARNAIGISRPIRVYCEPDQLVVFPDNRAQRGGQTVQLGPRTADSVDELVSAVWSHMEAWGIAGEGMFWRPVLWLEPSAGAERRVADLATLLAGSGFEIKLARPSAAQRTAPVQRTR